MTHGHHGANHPVKDLETGKVEIVSMNHGFTVDRETLPSGVKETHVSLFDGTNCGLRLEGKDVFSVQYHPEASPGPMDSIICSNASRRRRKPTQGDSACAFHGARPNDAARTRNMVQMDRKILVAAEMDQEQSG